MYRYGIFQGGGVKGIALVGALQVAEKCGIAFEAVGGASAGAIVAAMYAAGYSAAEMQLILEGVEFESLLDGGGWAPYALAFNLGLYRGRKFQSWIAEQLGRKKVRVLKDCPKLRIVATDLSCVFRTNVTAHFGIVTGDSGDRDRSSISAHRDRPFRHRDRPFRDRDRPFRRS